MPKTIPLDRKTTERIIKAVINWNGQKMEWHIPFLKLQDKFELITEVLDNGDLVMTTRLKKE